MCHNRHSVAFFILILRDGLSKKPHAILKPFCDAIWGPGQASNPRQSRESQPFVRLPPLYSPFSSIVTPYTRYPDLLRYS